MGVARVTTVGLLFLATCGNSRLGLRYTEGVAVQVARLCRFDDASHVATNAASEVVDAVRERGVLLELLVARHAERIAWQARLIARGRTGGVNGVATDAGHALFRVAALLPVEVLLMVAF